MQKQRKWLRRLGITAGIGAILLALFVVAFIFNPLEGKLADVAGVVPREVDFFLRKTNPAADFREFPEPWFWQEFAASKTWQELQHGPLVQGLHRDGVDQALQQARAALQQVRAGSHGLLDPLRDVAGRELIVAGYFENRTVQPPQPLPQPWWCVYTRVSWRVRAAWGLLRWGIVQSQAQKGGIDIRSDGPLLVIKPAGSSETLYAARQFDCLMIANDRHLLEQSLKLAQGFETEEAFGTTSMYTDGVVQRLRKWNEIVEPDPLNAVEFSCNPNTRDDFRRFAASWPNPNDVDSMTQRVLASFVNLKGWNSISGALMFESDHQSDHLSFLGEVVLNSKTHTAFQSSFFRAEQEPREKWMDPFLRMVPESACAAAALRMPAAEFINAMFAALPQNTKDMLNDGVRRSPYDNLQLADVRDLTEKLKAALLPRTGFVFKKNVPDEQIPVIDISPVPQVAWVFWIRDGSRPLIEQFVRWLRNNAQTLGFNKLFALKLNLSGTQSAAATDDPGEDVVKEFCNPGIDGTGEIAIVLFKDFFIVSNSGPLIRDMFWARYHVLGARSIVDVDTFGKIQKELPKALNGFVYVRGPQFAALMDTYREYAEKSAQAPDPGWQASVFANAEEQVRRSKFSQYGSKASMPEGVQNEFGAAVQQWIRDEWKRVGAKLDVNDIASIEQLRALAKGIDSAYMQVDLENNYIRFLGKIIGNYR
ncbi:MAG TPA: hypothetical protein VK348_02925 [Planctomycetota bacterium]|nr:hypothetical protein [Planctomycetota bacterium]